MKIEKGTYPVGMVPTKHETEQQFVQAWERKADEEWLYNLYPPTLVSSNGRFTAKYVPEYDGRRHGTILVTGYYNDHMVCQHLDQIGYVIIQLMSVYKGS